jgi:YbbR domain-containing protein
MNILRGAFRNIWWKLLSLGLATLVWIAIYHEPEMTSVLAAPVQFRNIPRDLEISSDIVESVDLEAHGQADLLRNLSEKRVSVVLDFSAVRDPGERTFTIGRDNTNLPRGVALVRVIPSQLRFTFEPRIVRNVPVEPQVSGTLPAGWHVVKLVSTPLELAVTGPESKVRRLSAVHTDPVDLTGIMDDKNVRVTAYLPNAQLRFNESPDVTVRVAVAK